MAKKKDDEQARAREAQIERRRQLLENKQSDQMRVLKLAIYGVAGLIGLIIVTGLIFEFFVTPNQAVAEVGSTTITLDDWQEIVRYQRTQLVIGIEEQYDLFLGIGGETEEEEAAEPTQEEKDQALRTVQQFSGQQIGLLTSGYEQLGEFVLEQMINDELIRQGIEERGLEVTEAEIDEVVGERFNFYGGDSPTPIPTATEAPEPTPSVTPIGFVEPEVEDAGEAVVEEPQAEPTLRPTATPVTQASFDEQLSEELATISGAGADADLYRELTISDIYRERLGEALFAESGEPTVVPHASFFLIEFNDAGIAEQTRASISDADGYLGIWNTLRTLAQTTTEDGSAPATPGRASELLWRTEAQLADVYADSAPAAIFDLAVGETSEVILDVDARTNLPVYLIVHVSGMEDRELSEFTINQLEQEILTEWVAEQRETKVTTFETWQGRVPRQPLLDELFRNPAPTPVPVDPAAQG